MKSNQVPKNTTVLIVDDDELTRLGVSLFLQGHGFQTLEAGDAHTAWSIAISHIPDVVIMDIVIPLNTEAISRIKDSVGVQLAIRLKRQYPKIGIVLRSAYEDRGKGVFELLEEGYRGIAYILKGSPPVELLEMIRCVLLKRVVINPEVTEAHSLKVELIARLTPEERIYIETAVSNFPSLTPREREVVHYLAASYDEKGTAEALHLKPKTVGNYTTRIYEKLGLDNAPPHLRKNVLFAKAYLIVELQEQQDE